MSTFDSLELGRYSDDGKDANERVAGMNAMCEAGSAINLANGNCCALGISTMH